MNETATDKIHHACRNSIANLYSLTKQMEEQCHRADKALARFSVYSRQKTHITLHHSLTMDSLIASWPAIRRYHMSYVYQGKIITKKAAEALMAQKKRVKLPWRDIGYHAGIEEIRYFGVYEILIGRDFFSPGAHCKNGGMNRAGFGFMFCGNFDIEPPPEPMLERAAEFLASMCRLGNISPDNIEGHNKYDSSKSCPGKLFDIDDFRNRVVENL